MKVVLAKSAGFCYGVRRAVELAEEKAAQGVPCVMLGSIIPTAQLSLSAPMGRAVQSMRSSCAGEFWCLTPPVLTSLVFTKSSWRRKDEAVSR